MKRFFGVPDHALTRDRPVLTLGVFDGVHRGHQAVLGEAVRLARECGASALVLTFDTHPQTVLAPGTAPPAITSLEHRLALFEDLGLDVAAVLPFQASLAQRAAEAFVRDLLAATLRVQAVVLGETARFGRDREGGLALLRRLGDDLGFAVAGVAPVRMDGKPVSSTAVREAVRCGQLARAARMLGRPVALLGTVVPGAGLGARLRFPTLNLDPHHELRPPGGVYATRTRVGDSIWPSVTNVGHRPTVDARTSREVLVESHVLDRDIGELYGQTAEVAFHAFLREEARFEDHDALARAIAQDVARARDWHAQHAQPG